jgi:flagellar basal body-associated protein FliL
MNEQIKNFIGKLSSEKNKTERKVKKWFIIILIILALILCLNIIGIFLLLKKNSF